MQFVVLLLLVSLVVAIEGAPQAPTTPAPVTPSTTAPKGSKPCKGSSEESGRRKRDGTGDVTRHSYKMTTIIMATVKIATFKMAKSSK